MVLLAGPAVNVVATQAGHRLPAEHDHVADVLHHVPVGRAEGLQRLVGEVRPEVAEEVVAGHEVRRVRPAGAPSTCRCGRGTGADRGHDPRVVLPFRRQVGQLRLLGVLGRHVAVAREAVQRHRRKCLLLGIDGGRVAAGTGVGELVPCPSAGVRRITSLPALSPRGGTHSTESRSSLPYSFAGLRKRCAVLAAHDELDRVGELLRGRLLQGQACRLIPGRRGGSSGCGGSCPTSCRSSPGGRTGTRRR